MAVLPERIQPAYLGYSVGKWEGDTQVVDTTGFNNRGWLEMTAGIPKPNRCT
jgi:hypothetical protein